MSAYVVPAAPAVVDAVIAEFGGDLRAALAHFIGENEQLLARLAYVVSESSTGYMRGRIRRPAGMPVAAPTPQPKPLDV